ncbi:hypothetical protein [Pyxidicoccus xibeiensis]|uniref:hypothetical protein n=1 Tax=Pyxidicoccus xibeiensis TaxID=2906759 RepID=UPI0020A7FFDA|nr:hypothetical protein [Pyxidicoccus xibeiensis]MCP3139659.1 hypothetical protein [Pyxidicoccus xibeiensis]
MTEKTGVAVVGEQPFAEILRTAWLTGVRNDYLSGFIGTERALQASLYFHLRVLGGGAHVYVEPRLPVGEQDFMPDLCVLLPEQAECWILELKLQNAANQGVVWESDFRKFATIEATADAGKELALRPRGRQDAVPLPIKNLRYAFVAVGDSSCGALDPTWLSTKAEGFLGKAANKTVWLGGLADTEEFRGPLKLR